MHPNRTSKPHAAVKAVYINRCPQRNSPLHSWSWLDTQPISSQPVKAQWWGHLQNPHRPQPLPCLARLAAFAFRKSTANPTPSAARTEKQPTNYSATAEKPPEA